MIEEKTSQPMDKYLSDNFYNSLNLRRTTFNPLKKFKVNHIVPTERDDKWRKGLVHGIVHDESAAMLGGIAGNAGLFSNSNDIAKMMQMYMQEGYYGQNWFPAKSYS